MFGLVRVYYFNAFNSFHMQIMAFIDEVTMSLRLVERQIVSLQIILMGWILVEASQCYVYPWVLSLLIKKQSSPHLVRKTKMIQ